MQQPLCMTRDSCLRGSGELQVNMMRAVGGSFGWHLVEMLLLRGYSSLSFNHISVLEGGLKSPYTYPSGVILSQVYAREVDSTPYPIHNFQMKLEVTLESAHVASS